MRKPEEKPHVLRGWLLPPLTEKNDDEEKDTKTDRKALITIALGAVVGVGIWLLAFVIFYIANQ